MHYQFAKRFLLTLTFLLLSVISIFIFVDPFGFYEMPLIKGFNKEKCVEEFYQRLSVARKIKLLKPASIIFGSSRTKVGIDVKDVENVMGPSTFNSAFNGASFNEIYDFFTYSLSLQPKIKSIVIGIDLFAFGKKRIYPHEFIIANYRENKHLLPDEYAIGFTWNGIQACLKTVKQNFDQVYLTKNKDEFLNPIKAMGEMKFLESMYTSEMSYLNYEVDPEKLELLSKLVKTCRMHGISLKLFICPVKAMYWEFYCQNGLWPSVEKLKRDIVSIYPLWDFSGFTPLTTESLDTNGKPLYHECSHFTSYAGQMLIQQMFNGPETSSLGCLLTPQNIDAHLEKILEDRKEWLKGPGKEINVKL